MRAAPCLPRASASAAADCSGLVTSQRTRDAADLAGDGARAVEIDVEACDLGAGTGELVGGRGAEARGSAGHDGSVSFDVHDQFVRVEAVVRQSGFSIKSAMPCPPPMQAEAMP